MDFYRNSFLEFSCSSYWILAAISPRSSVLNWRFLGYELLPRFHSGFVFKCFQSTFWELFLGFLTEFLLRFLQESFMRFLPETQTKFFQTCFRNFSFFPRVVRQNFPIVFRVFVIHLFNFFKGLFRIFFRICFVVYRQIFFVIPSEFFFKDFQILNPGRFPEFFLYFHPRILPKDVTIFLGISSEISLVISPIVFLQKFHQEFFRYCFENCLQGNS